MISPPPTGNNRRFVSRSDSVTARLWAALRRALFILCFALAATVAPGAEADAHKSLYLSLCAPCHGPDGRARTPAARKLGVKDLTQSRIPDAEIRQQISEGRRDKTGRQQMPPFADKLNDEQLAGLVSLVKGMRK